MKRPRFVPDAYATALFGMVLLASMLPAQGVFARVLETVTTGAIACLFFLHGARLSRQAITAGIMHWRLHVLIFLSTFALFPLIGVALRPLLQPLVTPDLYRGVLYLCVMPATVQSAIAFTSVARGNIAAAVCSASASTLLGIFISPLLVDWLVMPQNANAATGASAAHDAWSNIGKIMLQLLLPFALGHLSRSLTAKWIAQRAHLIRFFDQGSILLVVYTAFSAAVAGGLWHNTPLGALAGLLGICIVLLAIVLYATTQLARRLRFSTEDEITIVFCGSKKSLASGVPMAKVLFTPAMAGPMVLPLMVFHQLQLMVCAVLAARYSRRPDPDGPAQ